MTIFWNLATIDRRENSVHFVGPDQKSIRGNNQPSLWKSSYPRRIGFFKKHRNQMFCAKIWVFFKKIGSTEAFHILQTLRFTMNRRKFRPCWNWALIQHSLNLQLKWHWHLSLKFVTAIWGFQSCWNHPPFKQRLFRHQDLVFFQGDQKFGKKWPKFGNRSQINCQTKKRKNYLHQS